MIFFPIYILIDFSDFKVSLGEVFFVGGGSKLRKTQGLLEMQEHFLVFISDF